MGRGGWLRLRVDERVEETRADLLYQTVGRGTFVFLHLRFTD